MYVISYVLAIEMSFRLAEKSGLLGMQTITWTGQKGLQYLKKYCTQTILLPKPTPSGLKNYETSILVYRKGFHDLMYILLQLPSHFSFLNVW